MNFIQRFIIALMIVLGVCHLNMTFVTSVILSFLLGVLLGQIEVRQ